jgi:hypothetical protein
MAATLPLYRITADRSILTGAGSGPIDLRVDLEEIRTNIVAAGGSVDLDTAEETIFVVGGHLAGTKITYQRLPEPFEVINTVDLVWPSCPGGDLRWACCDSMIGPVCQHQS